MTQMAQIDVDQSTFDPRHLRYLRRSYCRALRGMVVSETPPDRIIVPMFRSRLLFALPAVALLAAPLSAQYKPKYTVEQFLSPPFPLVFASAEKADRVAWVG